MTNTSITFSDEAFRAKRKQSIETLGERTLLYTWESTLMVGRPDPIQARIVVPHDEWDAFWKQVDVIDVWSWTEYYRTARDGGKWSLELQRGDKQVTALGRNTGPDNYSQFYRILNQLVKGRLG